MPTPLPIIRTVTAALGALFVATSMTVQAETVLRTVPSSDLKVLDPIWTTALITRNHGFMIYDTLFGSDEKGNIRPQMVDKYSVSKDSLVWTFTLRHGLKFSDGRAFEALRPALRPYPLQALTANVAEHLLPL